MRIIFNGNNSQKRLKIFRMYHDENSLYIREGDNLPVRFRYSYDVEKNLRFVTQAVSAFLRTNPSDFRRLTSSMLNPNRMRTNLPVHSFHNLLETIETKCTYWNVGPLIYPDPFHLDSEDFRMRIPHYPIGDFKDSLDHWISSYYPPISQYWVIKMSKSGIITICDHRDDNNVFTYTSKPNATKDERLLTPDIFIKAMRNFIELDFDGFGDTVKELKSLYKKSPNSWNILYWQLCLMETVYRHFQEDICEVRFFCPWISYD